MNNVSHVVSLLDPDTAFPVIRQVGDHHLRLEVHDIEEDEEGMDPLCATRTKHILDFVGGW
ncbi:MAG: hypothetical protein ABL932_22280, partial [Terricaulis sp.]